MQKYPLLSFAVLVSLIFPLVYLLSGRNAPSALPGIGVLYFATFLSGPLLLIYGFITYRFGEQRVLSWIAFAIGGLWTGYVYIWGTWKLFIE